MANDDDPQKSASQLTAEIRSAFSAAYTALEAKANTQAFETLTFEDCVDAEIERLSGSGTYFRKNALERTTSVAQKLVSAANQFAAIPVEDFQSPRIGEDVNTPDTYDPETQDAES